MSQGVVPTAKVIILGESGVGKTSIALRFTKDEFNPYSESTIGASYLTKTIVISHKQLDHNNDDDDDDANNNASAAANNTAPSIRTRIQLNLWDTAGEEKYHSLTAMYYRGAEAAVLVYDICDEASFTSIRRWADELKRCGPPDLTTVVCGNKRDLECTRRVSWERAEGYARGIGADYVETSARDGANVDGMFERIGRLVKDAMIGCGRWENGDGDVVDLEAVLDNRWYCC